MKPAENLPNPGDDLIAWAELAASQECMAVFVPVRIGQERAIAWAAYQANGEFPLADEDWKRAAVGIHLCQVLHREAVELGADAL